jgi:hypothetical protein
MKKNYVLAYAISTILVISGCSAGIKPEVNDAITSVDKAIESANTILSAEIESKPYVRRMEAVKYYINNGDLPEDQNFNSRKPKESFALFVCTGSGALHREIAALKYTKAYSDALKGISSLGEDTFSGQFRKLLELQLPVKKLQSSETIKPEDAFKSCIEDTIKNLNGYPASDVTGELDPTAIIAAIQASKELLDYLKELAKDGVKTANKFMIGEKLEEFDKVNREELQGALTTDLSEVRLENAWKRRQAVSLYQPFETFNELLNQPRSNTKYILELGQLTNSQLSTFDLLRKTTSPSNIVNRLRLLENQLHSAITDDEINLDKVILYIKYITEDFDLIKNDYEKISASWKEAKPKIEEAIK